MEKKIASSSLVELLDKDMLVKTENYNNLFGHTVCNGKPTDLTTKTVRSHQQGTCLLRKQHCPADGNTFTCVAEDQEVPNPHQSITGKTSSLCCETNSLQVIGHRKHESNDHHEIRGSTQIRQPPHTSFSRKSGLFYCLKCGCRFQKLENLVKHGKVNCSVRCHTCGKQFERVSTLRRHKRAHHMSPANRGKSRQKMPQEPPKKPVQCVCSHCGRVFKNMTALNSHILTHTGERPFECRVAGCSKRFAQHSTRSFHERTHSDDMPHICAVCGRRFKHAVGVYLHMSLHSGLKPHHCASCPMTFRRACDLQRHSHRHSGERPYSCTECPKRFKTKKTLDRHILALHSDEIPYRCSICDKGFKTSGNLHIHMRVHTGDRPYICAVCGVRFAYAGSLKSHMQAHLGAD